MNAPSLEIGSWPAVAAPASSVAGCTSAADAQEVPQMKTAIIIPRMGSKIMKILLSRRDPSVSAYR
jgi:hypothetical protein